MLFAFLVTWLFWGIIIGLLITWRRSWIPILAFPVVLSTLWWIVAQWSASLAKIASILFHSALLLIFLFVLVIGRRAGDTYVWRRPTQ